MKSARILFALAVAVATQLSCNVNDYCLGCFTGDGGVGDDSKLDDGGGGSGTIDAEPCVPTGSEVCDGEDNDCNGLVDDGVLPEVGTLCPNQMGVCAGGTYQCVAGVIKCDKAPSPEICDTLDNNCNGQPDEGNPGGGAKCGTDMGECVAGLTSCNTATGVVECFGFQDHTMDPELCDGKDNDCDGNFDEGLGSLGTCGPATGDGECVVGTLACQGGATVCLNAVFPAFETCNMLDDDCDNKTDETFDFDTDPRNCGGCGEICPSHANSNVRCNNGACGYACVAGYHDLTAADGCEYGPCFISGNEECDGVDNDCDNKIDEGMTPPAICLQGGECGATTATCQGMNGWTCSYPGAVQFPETRCDSKDNDCDTRVDEGQPKLGDACDDGRVGICRSTGTYACDSANLDGAATCEISMPGQANPDPSESCNGKDDDCDGTTDEDASDNFVEVKNASDVTLFRVYAYEASRPDASDVSVGTISERACSRPGVLPWASVTQAQAAAACAAVDPAKNSRLCTAAEWQLACEGNAGRTYPYGNTFQPNTCNGNAYDPNCTLPDDDRALLTGAPHGCPTKPAQSSCVSPSGAFDMSGNLKEWTSTQMSPGAFSIRGGAYDSVAGGLACDFQFVTASPTFTFANLGFRCCADP